MHKLLLFSSKSEYQTQYTIHNTAKTKRIGDKLPHLQKNTLNRSFRLSGLQKLTTKINHREIMYTNTINILNKEKINTRKISLSIRLRHIIAICPLEFNFQAPFTTTLAFR